jgi:hypothetical protein
VPAYIPAGQRKGLLATFNGGFKLNSAGGGFYLNGIYHGTLVKGAASVVYYKNGTIKIGEWGRDFSMNSSIAGVRQNLKLLVDHGRVSTSANSDVMAHWGATLGGGYYVWRSGIGITRDGRRRPSVAPGVRAAADRGAGPVRRARRALHRAPGGRPDHAGGGHAVLRGGVADPVLRRPLRGVGKTNMRIPNGSGRFSRVLLLGGTSEIGIAILSALSLDPRCGGHPGGPGPAADRGGREVAEPPGHGRLA